MLYLVAYSEIGLKGRNRQSFVRRLVRNLSEVCSSVDPFGSRFLCEADEPPLIFGIAYAAPVDLSFTFNDLDDLADMVSSHYHPEGTFRITARREGKHPFTSMDIQREVGARIDAPVDLHNPSLNIHVDVIGDRCVTYTKVLRGPGGLPLGTSSPLLTLFSGGLDSPVASWMMMKRGCPQHYFFINLAGPGYEQQVYDVFRTLTLRWAVGHQPILYSVDGRPLVKAIQERVRSDYNQLVLKASMYALASRLALSEGLRGVVTGESLGQVSTQTVENLGILTPYSSLPVFRPLIGLNKEEITTLARSIGTYDLSITLKEVCNISRGRVVTRGDPDILRSEFNKVSDLLDDIYSTLHVVKPTLPERYTIVDLDDLPRLRLRKDEFYVITCRSGLRAERAAADLRAEGYRAMGISEAYARRLKNPS